MKKILIQIEEKRYNIIKRIANTEERSVNAQIRLLLKQAVSYYIRYNSKKIQLNEEEELELKQFDDELVQRKREEILKIIHDDD